MVDEIRPGPKSSDPRYIASFARRAFFSAQDGEHGRELWKSNGTPAGTKRVTDFAPRQAIVRARPHKVHGALFFGADDGTHGAELWKTDGSPRGTKMVKNIAPGNASSWPDNLRRVGTDLFFTADDGRGYALWRSDGTARGTRMVKVFTRPGDPPHGPWSLTSALGTLFFLADDGVHGEELWRSDGTASGTRMVKDITPPGSPYTPAGAYSGRVTLHGELFFGADDHTHGYELWKSDGTEAGTRLVKDANPAENRGVGPFDLTKSGGELFFAGNDGTHGTELWKSDGTEAGTQLVEDIDPRVIDGVPYGSFPGQLTSLDGTLFFIAYQQDGTSVLWRSDGTAPGTEVVSDLHTEHPYDADPRVLAVLGGSLLLTNGPIGQKAFWQSDGSTAGTVKVRPLTPVSVVLRSIVAGGKVFFSALDERHGIELWKAVP